MKLAKVGNYKKNEQIFLEYGDINDLSSMLHVFGKVATAELPNDPV